MNRRLIPQLIMLAALLTAIFSWGTAQAIEATFCASDGRGYRLEPALNEAPGIYCFAQGSVFGPYKEKQIPFTVCKDKNLSFQGVGMTPDETVSCPQPPAPEPEPEPAGCNFSKSGAGSFTAPMTETCAASNGVTLQFKTTATGGLLSQDLMASEAQGQLTIRILSASGYTGRAQIRLQGETEAVTFTPPQVLNDGYVHVIRVVVLDGQVHAWVDQESVGVESYGQPLASAAMPVVLGGHCMYCTNNSANDIRDTLNDEAATILAEYMEVDEILSPSPVDPPPIQWGTARWYNPETSRDGTPLTDLGLIRIFDNDTDEQVYEHITYDAGAQQTVTFESAAECIYLRAYDLTGNESPRSFASCDPDAPAGAGPSFIRGMLTIGAL